VKGAVADAEMAWVDNPDQHAFAQPTILGFDPGRQKCGVAIVGVDRLVCYYQVVPSDTAIATIQQLQQQFSISLIVMGDQTTSQEWKHRLQEQLADSLPIVLVDERNSSLEARDRYWQMHPARGAASLVPKALRRIPRPIDDIVAILLIERYLGNLVSQGD
jgi:RNase H-fold protein (predicted Holliday junction resolvase)